MSERTMDWQEWQRTAAASRPSAGRNVRLADGIVLYDTRAEAVEAARRVRDRIAAEVER